MRRKILPLTLLIAALSLTACRSNTTYKFPTHENEFKVRKIDAEDIRIFNESYLEFAKQNSAILSKSNDNFAFPVVSTYQTALTLLSAAETETYNEVARILYTDAPDDYSLVQGLNNLIAPYTTAPTDNFKFGASIWMVWPIVLEPDFQDESAARIGSDVIRLGSFGLTAQRSVQRWLDRYDLETPAPKFDRSSPMMALGAISATIQIEFSKDESNGDPYWLGFCTNADQSDSPFRVLAWPASLGVALPDDNVSRSLLANEKPNSPPGPKETKTIATQLDITPLIKSVNSETLLNGPNDFRNMSVEVIPQGDKIGIPLMTQYTRLNLSISGINPFSEPINYAIYDKKTGLPLIVGKSTP